VSWKDCDYVRSAILDGFKGLCSGSWEWGGSTRCVVTSAGWLLGRAAPDGGGSTAAAATRTSLPLGRRRAAPLRSAPGRLVRAEGLRGSHGSRCLIRPTPFCPGGCRSPLFVRDAFIQSYSTVRRTIRVIICLCSTKMEDLRYFLLSIGGASFQLIEWNKVYPSPEVWYRNSSLDQSVVFFETFRSIWNGYTFF